MFNDIKIYAAGKISKNDWRDHIVTQRGLINYSYDNKDRRWPDSVSIASLPGAEYVGPFFIGCDHGCLHGSKSHGQGASNMDGGCIGGEFRSDVLDRCLWQIKSCTHMFVWIDDLTAYGTLTEIGYARAHKKKIYIYTKDWMIDSDELWFSNQMASFSMSTTSAESAWKDFTLRLYFDVQSNNLQNAMNYKTSQPFALND